MHYVLNGKKVSPKELCEMAINLNYFDREQMDYESMRSIEDMFCEFGHSLLKVNNDGSYEILNGQYGQPQKLFLH